MSIVNDLKDEWQGLANARAPWEIYWRDIARYVLPQTESFDRIFATHQDSAITSVVSTPVASRQSKELYDMTSLWAIERLTAGMLSLKTPESNTWHNLGLDSYFGQEPSHEEEQALERLRNYLFRVRANPNTGFWPAHRAAMKSMCAFGDGWMYVEEQEGRSGKTPFRYEWLTLAECYPGMSPQGMPNRMFRVYRWSFEQVVRRFGTDKVPGSVVEKANDLTQKHHTCRVMHAVRPRSDSNKTPMGVRSGSFESHYCLPDESHHIGEGGYYEFPFVRYAWSNTGVRPFSEGPVAYAIGEIKSMQEMAKNELIAIQSTLRPAFGTAGKNFVKLNLNPGATNPNMITPDGKPLFAPLNVGSRPDFAQAVMESRRNSIREMLYLNLWQIIIQEKDQTATEALIRAQEKGEMLGPVGISLNEGLSGLVDREISILGRKRAFEQGSPLEMPDSMANEGVSPVFTSPLDRLRRMGEIVGMQRLVEFAMLLAGGDPNQGMAIMARFDIDEMLDKAQDILGAPVSVLRSREDAEGSREQAGQMNQMMQALAAMKGGGEAAKAMGEGGAAMAEGAEMAGNAPNLQQLMQTAPQIAQQVARTTGGQQ